MQVEILLNCYEYEALIEAMKNSGKSLDVEFDKLIASFYNENVPLGKRQEAERKQKADEHYDEELNDPRKFAIVHLHDEEGDFYFIAENQFNFFRVASKLYYGDIEEAEKYSLKGIAKNMCYKEDCEKFIFSVLEKAQAHDSRVASVFEIDYESREVAVQEYGKQRAKYRFHDLSDAVEIAENNIRQSEYIRNEIFRNAIIGKECETESIGMTGQIPPV